MGCGGAIATPDYAAWLLIFPNFSNVTSDQYSACWDLATQFCRNDGTGPVSKPTVQQRLLNLLAAHWAFLLYGDANSGGASQLVGRINSAAEGSVNVGTENNYPPGTVQWFQQTKYGSAFWAASAPYRTMHYRSFVTDAAIAGVYNPTFPVIFNQ